MLKIDDTLVSLDVVDANFTCDLEKCKGACCVQGDSGAPLLEEEVTILEKVVPDIYDYLQPEGVETLKANGVFTIDRDDELVTPLIDGKECAYTVFDERGIARCGIEKAYFDGKTTFRKPVSCHLYPVRIKRYHDYYAVNYDRWGICSPAIDKGNREKTPVFRFVDQALKRSFGNDWYKHLTRAAKAYHQEKNKHAESD